MKMTSFKKYLTEKNIDYKKLITELEISNVTFYSWLKGEFLPSPKNMKKLKLYLNATDNELYFALKDNYDNYIKSKLANE